MKPSHSPRIAHLAAALAVLIGVAFQARGDEEEMASTPRAALDFFLHATRAGDYAQATQVFAAGANATPLLARELRAVLDERTAIDPSAVSDKPDGIVEEIGRVTVGNGSEPVRLVHDPAGKWVFSATTVAHVPDWYAALPDHRVRELLPDTLLQYGPRDLLWWQWMALIPIFLLSLGLGTLLAYLARKILHVIATRTDREFDTRLIHRLEGPLVLIAGVGVARTLTAFLFFTRQSQSFMSSLNSALVLAAIFWGLLRSIDLGIEALRGRLFANGRPERIALLPLFSKAAKVVLVIVAVVEVLQRLGYQAASLLAGLGIGGLAVALAAQKTVENLFGSVMLAIDQPFRIGDTVQIDTLIGTIEQIGFRSTRIRTAGRTIVTIPNGRLSDMRIESFAPRDRMRLDFVLNVAQSAKADQIRKILDEITAYLKSLPQVVGVPEVYFTNITPNSLDIAVGLGIATTDDRTYQTLKQDILLKMLGIVESNGAALAMPNRAVHMIQRAAPPGV